MRRDDFLQSQVFEVERKVFVETGPRGVITVAIYDLIDKVCLIVLHLVFYVEQSCVELVVFNLFG